MMIPDENTKTIEAKTNPSRQGRALQQAYLAEILAGRRKSSLDIVMGAFQSGYPIRDIYMDIFQESLYEIGRLWETNRITVADEHMGTAITQYVMSNLFRLMEISVTTRGKVVITGVQGELHQVGANMVSDVLESDGWNVLFLGTNVPPEGVIQSLRQHGADIFGISSTMFFNIPQVIELVKAVRREFGQKTPQILLGGSAFRMLPQLPEAIEGCFVALNLQQALDLARSC